MAVATMMDQYGVDVSKVRFVSGQGAAAALQDLAAGGVDIVPSSLPEASPLIQAGRIKSLVVMGDERLEAFPDVPTLAEATDIGLRLGSLAWTSGSPRVYLMRSSSGLKALCMKS